ncbi:ABC transporter ATP-binding protein [Parvimonas micra]|jgi:lipoprotein ABC transporter, ATP-binding protein|uniref:ABC transporter ATP-binding protein n=1 Tax=Parvimonas micra TaxID=33033 RepID=A0A9X3HBG5_9FIRM|nr:ABC transporter ATP-binding protein [Parvimonas micra]HEQ6988661.1 ABC transporter ATP-binding protein [Streptococcus pyogenes]HEV9128706.1 ABC transporter ATP-binding protein [Streptococcus pneumoniae]MCZ7407352.1 ABC transporter ATP-binding protein [Parvimonas micra]MCZ7410422.1 ABC transporter ATP-binding protein [Parvimonas micra]MCZ7412380.1 ABC transporter ATP-binding protein [Parvimonas micra]
MNILELKNVNKSYDGRKIIDNLTISIPENSLVAITGKSGSGKSTILNMIGLLESIDSGSIKINGNSIPNINSSKATMLRRNTINYLFQSYALISDITVLDNLMVAMEFLDLSKKEKNDKIDKVLKDLDIFILKNKKVNTLSGGEQQRVALARCILKPGNLILADEPTGSLDPKMAEIVFELIKYLRDKYNKTVIIVTHDISLANKADFIVDLSEMKK